MARPKKSEARDTRGLILSSALECFAEGGYFGTSMRQIARAVGVRESALYHHFPSKDSILKELLKSLGPGLASNVGQLDVVALGKALGFRELLRTVVQHVLTAWATPEEQRIIRVIMQEGPRLEAEGIITVTDYMTRARGQLQKVIEALVQAKLVRPVDPVPATLLFMGPMMVLRMRYLAFPSRAPDFAGLKEEADRLVDLLLSLLTPPEAGGRGRAR
jgi:AcrR family transcriptional regulator